MAEIREFMRIVSSGDFFRPDRSCHNIIEQALQRLHSDRDT